MCSSHAYHFCMVSSHPAWVHAFSQSFASKCETHQRFFGIHSSFRSNFIYRIFHDGHPVLLLHLLLFCQLLLLALQTLHIFYSLNKEKILAQQSSLFFRIFNLLFLRTLLHSKGLPLPLKAPILLSSTLYLSRTSSSILSAKFFQHRSISHWFRLLGLFISSVSHFFIYHKLKDFLYDIQL